MFTESLAASDAVEHFVTPDDADDAVKVAAGNSRGKLVKSVQQQQEYIERLKAKDFDYSLVVADAFVRGMRDIGYKSTGTALDEEIDNGIEAGAEDVMVEFGYNSESGKKVGKIAIIDNGSGMSPEMLRAAVLWGGGHRENSRSGFGRFGFGLPSSCVSIGNRFEVYSKLEGGEWYMTYLDLVEMSNGSYYQENNRFVSLPAKPAKLPSWVVDAITSRLGTDDLEHGTVVLIDKVDRASPSTTAALERELLEHFGTIYRNYVRRVNIFVNNKKVEPVDPLFLDSTARFYDMDSDGKPLNHLRAVALEPISVSVKDENKKVIGTATVRFSYLPAGFQTASGKVSDGKKNARFKIMKENNGILVLRAGRQVDVIRRIDWFTFQNNDYNVKVEIDFPPTLDEEFSITTMKQQIVISERMWELLDRAGVKRAILEDMRKRRDKDYEQKRQEEADPSDGEARASELAMADAARFQTRTPDVSPEQQSERQKRLEDRITEVAKTTGKPIAEVTKTVEEEVKNHPYRITFETSPEAPFYRAEAIGTQIHVVVNRAHPFFANVYMGPYATPRLQTQLELLLFVLAQSEIESQKDRRRFYESERQEWSRVLRLTLQLHDEMEPKEDFRNAQADQLDIFSEANVMETEIKVLA